MKRVLLGQFNTPTGKLVVSDPCYGPNSRDQIKVTVRPGTYHAFLTKGQLRKALFGVDKDPRYQRVARLEIIHEDFLSKSLNFNFLTKLINDSGTMAILRREHYWQNSPEEVLLTGPSISHLEEFLRRKFTNLQFLNKILRLKKANPDLDLSTIEDKTDNLALSIVKSAIEVGHKHLGEIQNRAKEIELLESLISGSRTHALEQLAHRHLGTFPHYLQPQKSQDFREIMRHLSSGAHDGGVHPFYGTVSRTGLGDIGAAVFTASSGPEIIAIGCKYLNLREIK